MAKNTARRPNIHWYGRDLIKEGYLDELLAYVPDEMRVVVQAAIEKRLEELIMGLYTPEDLLGAWQKLIDGDLSPDGRKEAERIIKQNPPDLTWRMDDEERTLCGSYNQSHVCPPDCS